MKEAAPLHAYEVRISIGANSKEDLDRAFADIRDDFARGVENAASGGWGGCYSITTAKRDISPDAYRAELTAWHERQSSESEAAR